MAAFIPWRRGKRPADVAPETAAGAAPVGFTDLFPPSEQLPPESPAYPPPSLDEVPSSARAPAPLPPDTTVRVQSATPAAQPSAHAAPVSEVLAGWAMDETAYWRLNPVHPQAAETIWRQLNDTTRSIFIYRIGNGAAELMQKDPALVAGEGGMTRALAYLKFFQTVAPLLPAEYVTTFAVETEDRFLRRVDCPVFCFQKAVGANAMLLPDIDMLLSDFYQDPGVQDRIAYRDKMQAAVFVGSTTGGTISPELARNNGTPRLRAANFFTGNDRVVFSLPNIVQFSNEEARILLEQKPYCRKDFMSWQEQLQRRFILSMDGNGATCSRVAVALASNSVLLKYESPEQLYYFRGLQRWLHYVPVPDDAAVDKLLDMEALTPAIFEAIARNGRRFATEYLSRERVTDYVVKLLIAYGACFSDQAPLEARAAQASPPTAPPTSQLPPMKAAPRTGLFLLAHVENHGDVLAEANGWVGRQGSGLRIEGFSFSLASVGSNRAIRCRAVQADGSLGEAMQGGSFCGTRSQNTPLFGFVIEVPADAGRAVSYEATFIDGTALGPMAANTVCKADSGAALEALRFHVEGGASEAQG